MKIDELQDIPKLNSEKHALDSISSNNASYLKNKNMYDITLSVFFPCYNEELNIEGLVLQTIETLKGMVTDFEILIVDDGSTDNTGSIADKLSKQYNNVRVIHHKKNTGYGSALISGIRNSSFDWIFFTDGDNQFFINEISNLLKEIDNYDLIIGYRGKREDPWPRIVNAYLWRSLIQILFKMKVKDTNCAFKLIKKNIIKDIQLTSNGAAITTELLVKLKNNNARIKEVKVSHRPRRFGKQTGSNPKVVFHAFVELFKLYLDIKRQVI